MLGKPENLTSGLVLVLLLMLIIDKLDIAIFCIDWIYNNCYFILHCGSCGCEQGAIERVLMSLDQEQLAGSNEFGARVCELGANEWE